VTNKPDLKEGGLFCCVLWEAIYRGISEN